MKPTINTSEHTTLLRVLTACVVLAGARSLIAAPHFEDAPEPIAVEIDVTALAEQVDPGSPFDEMFADWGYDTSFDLDCSGTVDIQDYLAAIPTGDGLLILGIVTRWGTGSPWDLNCDGTVGIGDFLQMAGEAIAEEPGVESQLDALFADWGMDTRYDVNCDGVVDLQDYLIVISNPAYDALFVLGVITHWGTGTSYDLNCDGTVGIQDYLLLLGDFANAAQP